MTDRTADDFAHERATLDAAHQQNETQRDSFVALAHTALFAASVSFVGSVTPLRSAAWKPLLIGCWSFSVFGLLALTLSFHFSRRAIDARRAALNDDVSPAAPVLDLLNAVSLWSFPASLLCLFLFVTANVVSADEPSSKSPAATAPDLRLLGRPGGVRPSTASADARARAGSSNSGTISHWDRDEGQHAAAAVAQPHCPGWRHPRRRRTRSPSADAESASTAAPTPTEEVIRRRNAGCRCS